MSIISKFKIIGTVAGKVATSKTAKIVVPVISVGCTLLSGIQQKNDVIEGMNQGLTYDTIIVDLHLAWESLKEIIGNVDKEELLDSIFKNFCLGK